MDELLGRQSACDEAKALYRMLVDENSVEELRRLIAVPRHIEQRLREFAAVYPEEQPMIDRVLKFRAAVLAEFNRLVTEGAEADSEEIEETESQEMVLLA